VQLRFSIVASNNLSDVPSRRLAGTEIDSTYDEEPNIGEILKIY